MIENNQNENMDGHFEIPPSEHHRAPEDQKKFLIRSRIDQIEKAIISTENQAIRTELTKQKKGLEEKLARLEGTQEQTTE